MEFSASITHACALRMIRTMYVRMYAHTYIRTHTCTPKALINYSRLKFMTPWSTYLVLLPKSLLTVKTFISPLRICDQICEKGPYLTF